MAITIWRKPYVLRRHEPQTINDKGYASAPFSDMTVHLNVQPMGANDLLALPEGARTVKRIVAFGNDELISADEINGIPGDYLFYFGAWYECTSCVRWKHTFLRHFHSQFVILPQKEQPGPPVIRKIWIDSKYWHDSETWNELEVSEH